MNTKTLIAQIAISALALPVIAVGASVGSSLIAGLSPEEAVQVLATQIDTITGRVDQVEKDQSDTASTTAQLVNEIASLREQNQAMGSTLDVLTSRPPQVEIRERVVEVPVITPVVGAAEEQEADTVAPRVSLTKLGNEWKNEGFFAEGLYGDVGIEEWNFAKDTEGGIATVTWILDGAVIEPERPISTGSFKMVLHTAEYANGEHTLTLRATDKAGNTSEGSVTVIIKN